MTLQESLREKRASLREAEAAAAHEVLVAVKALVEVDMRKDQLSSAEIPLQTTTALILRLLNLFKLSPNLRRPPSKFSQMHPFLILTCRLNPAILNVFKSKF